MAARRTRTHLDEKWRERIQTSMLINRLQDNVIGKIDLSANQIKSIEILLRKSAPDLSHATGDFNVTSSLADVLTELNEARRQARTASVLADESDSVCH